MTVHTDHAYRDADMICLPCGWMPQPADILPTIVIGLRLPPKQSGALPDIRNLLQVVYVYKKSGQGAEGEQRSEERKLKEMKGIQRKMKERKGAERKIHAK